MKKIIATVLAMVMALALCTVAFAAEQTYDVFGKTSDVAIDTDVTVTYHKADADANTIAYYEVESDEDGIADYYVKVAKAADADLVLKYTGKTTVAMYLAEVPAYHYDGEATAYTNVGTTCGKLNYKDFPGVLTKSSKLFTAIDEDDDETYLFVKIDKDDIDEDTVFLLVDGSIVPMALVDDAPVGDLVVPHTWVVDSEKLTAKCSACGATGKVYENYTEVPSGATAEEVAGGLWVVADASNSTTDDNKNTSPKTFDAGIAMYVGMALTSVAGSAVVIGKKKEF